MATSTQTADTPITYARARLWLGITCVGAHVMIALAAIGMDLPRRWLPAEPVSFEKEWISIAAFLLVMGAVMLPFDIVGGWVLPRRFQRTRESLGAFARRIVRAMAVQMALLFLVLCLYRAVGSSLGGAAVVVTFALAQCVLIAFQLPIARSVGALREDDVDSSDGRFLTLSSTDPGFTGSVAGWPGRETIIVPALWKRSFSDRLLQLAIARRQLAISTRRRLFGIAAAVAWNSAALAAAICLPGADVYSVAGLATAYFYFALFSFLGLLLLPFFNRRAVLAVDRLAVAGSSIGEMRRLTEQVEELADGEPNRSVQLESVFHPIPCVERRLEALIDVEKVTGRAWNVARTALFCAWAFGGPLSRSVHCNIGRPDLWVIFPTD